VEVFEAADGFSRALDAARSAGRTVGLVPTMGALHAGHRSLIARAAEECDHVAVTVFVNPLQFGDPDDIENYPRTLPSDLELCMSDGVSSVLAPSVAEMYPGWPASPPTTVSVSGPSEGWEGSARPGHFDGVCTVVAKLFSMAGRCRAYFGEKDYQQLAVVRQMASDLCMPVEVVACPTVREPDGLALSSRNARLSASERAAAPVLWRALSAAREAVASVERWPDAVAELMAATVGTEPLVRLEYAAAVDAASLVVPPSLDPPTTVRLLVAARVGPVRLIDNCDAPLAERAPQMVGAGPARAEETRRRTPCNAA
jgi:pantoate--beta-alanine ligase